MKANSIADDVRQQIEKQMAAIKAQAAGSMDKLDKRIQALDAELSDLNGKSVRRVDVQVMIAKDLKDAIQPHRAGLMHRAGAAKFLSKHTPITTYGVINGDGRAEPKRIDPGALQLVEKHKPDPWDLLALVLTDTRIDEFAAAAAAMTDAPEDGRTIDELKARADAVSRELGELHEERYKLRGELSALIDVALSPCFDGDPFNRPPQVVDIGPRAVPSVKQMNQHGEMVETIIDGYAKAMGERYAADDAERAMQQCGH